jgi:hypothetical protein
MLGKTVISTTAALVCVGLGSTSAGAEMSSVGLQQGGFGDIRAVIAAGAWNGEGWDTGAGGGRAWWGAGWRSRGWSWDSNWGWGWPAPAAAWYYGPYYGACLQPQWTGNGWVRVNVC